MTYYIGQNVLTDLLGTGNPRYFYALRRTDDGLVSFAKIDQLKDAESITVNVAGPNDQNYEDFEYGTDYFDGRLENDHSRPFENLYWDQYRWDGKNMFYYINEQGELVVRINQKYDYPAVFVGSIDGTTLTVTEMDSGVITVGMTLDAPNIETGTTIVRQLTNTANTGVKGSTGTYEVSETQTFASTTIRGAV